MAMFAARRVCQRFATADAVRTQLHSVLLRVPPLTLTWVLPRVPPVKLPRAQAPGGNIVEFHSCEFFPERWFDLVRLLTRVV